MFFMIPPIFIDSIRQIFNFGSTAERPKSTYPDISMNAVLDPEMILETVLGFVSDHYAQLLILSSGFSIVLTILSVLHAVKFLCKGRKCRKGSPEYFELLRKVHAVSGDVKHEETQISKTILRQYPEMINSPMKPYNFTPFLRACWAANTDLVRFMIKHGADIQRTTLSGDNAFFLAAYNISKTRAEDFDPEILQVLLDAGSDINQLNKRGLMAIHTAAKEGHKPLTYWLLTHGTDPDAGNGPHPLDIAHTFNDEKHRDVASLLAKYSFKPLLNIDETPEYIEGLSNKILPSFFFQSDFLTENTTADS